VSWFADGYEIVDIEKNMERKNHLKTVLNKRWKDNRSLISNIRVG
jgi:hypothetical protein